MSNADQVVVRFRYRGSDYRLEVEPSAAQRLADAEGSFVPDPVRRTLRDHLFHLTHRSAAH